MRCVEIHRPGHRATTTGLYWTIGATRKFELLDCLLLLH